MILPFVHLLLGPFLCRQFKFLQRFHREWASATERTGMGHLIGRRSRKLSPWPVRRWAGTEKVILSSFWHLLSMGAMMFDNAWCMERLSQ